MSHIEKALEKFKKESKKSVEQIPSAEGEVDNSSLRSIAKDNTVNGDLAIQSSQSMPDAVATKHESPIMSAVKINENSETEIVPSVQEKNIDEHKAEDVTPSKKIDTFSVEEHIVSYYDSIKKQMWKGPVMVHFRKLLLSLTSMQKNKMCKVILFTSEASQDGKSMISLNTAITLCGDNKNKVAIVDCDFRNPSINDLLGFSTEIGLSDYLAKKAKIKDIFFNGLVPGLTIIPAGNKPPNTCELFASDKKKQFMSYLRERFDYVIIDTPPVLTFPDTSILAPLSDGVVFVINSKKSKKSVVKRAIETLHDCNIMGFVMNRSEVLGSDYYGYPSSYDN